MASGVGPFSGQCVRFKHFAPEPKAYALNRYDFEAWRHWALLDAHFAQRRCMLSETYSLVDMAVSGWARVLLFVLGAEASVQLPNVKRLLDEINARPAAQCAEVLKTRRAVKAEMDDAVDAAMFPQNAQLAN